MQGGGGGDQPWASLVYLQGTDPRTWTKPLRLSRIESPLSAHPITFNPIFLFRFLQSLSLLLFSPSQNLRNKSHPSGFETFQRPEAFILLQLLSPALSLKPPSSLGAEYRPLTCWVTLSSHFTAMVVRSKEQRLCGLEAS